MTSQPFGGRLAERLLSELRSAPGLTGKIAFAARNWQKIQSLDKGERERVALAMGSREGSRLLEKFFARDGELSAEEQAVKQAFGRLGEADPADLREIASSVRKGDFDGLRRKLAVPVAAVAGDAVAEDAVAEDTVAENAVAVDAVAVDAAAVASPSEVPAHMPPVPVLASPPEPVAEAAIEIHPPTPPPEVDDAMSDVALLPKADVDPPAPDRPSPRSFSSDDPPSAARRLALLRGLHRGTLALETPADRAAFLESLETDWAARRGLSQLIRSGRLTDLDEALGLVDRIGSAAQRAWCLGDLIEHWDLDSRATEKVLAAAPSAATRRRLGRRTAPLSVHPGT